MKEGTDNFRLIHQPGFTKGAIVGAIQDYEVAPGKRGLLLIGQLGINEQKEDVVLKSCLTILLDNNGIIATGGIYANLVRPGRRCYGIYTRKSNFTMHDAIFWARSENSHYHCFLNNAKQFIFRFLERFAGKKEK